MPKTINEYIDVEDIVRLTNNGDTTWRAGWNSKQYTCQPGKSIFVPMHVVINEFGDPRSATLAQRALSTGGRYDFIPSREAEVSRLCQLYGAYDDVEKMMSKAPRVSLEDQNGNPIYGVIHDTEGNSIMSVSPPTTVDEREYLHSKINELEARFKALESGEDKSNAQPVDEVDDLDTSPTGPNGQEIPDGTRPDMPTDFSSAFTK